MPAVPYLALEYADGSGTVGDAIKFHGSSGRSLRRKIYTRKGNREVSPRNGCRSFAKRFTATSSLTIYVGSPAGKSHSMTSRGRTLYVHSACERDRFCGTHLYATHRNEDQG